MVDPNEHIDAYLEDELSPAQTQAFCDWLAADPSHAEQFADRAMLHHHVRTILHRDRIEMLQAPELDLHELVEMEASAQGMLHHLDADEPEPAPEAKPLRLSEVVSVIRSSALAYITPRSLRITAVATAAAILLAAALIVALSQGGAESVQPGNEYVQPPAQPVHERAPVVATLTAERDAQWKAASGTVLPALGDELHAGQWLTLTDGVVEVTTARGAVAVLEAPCQIELLSDNSLYLHRGKLVGICRTESSKGFVVETLFAEVEDLGTEFGIEAHEGKVTTTVFTGKVEMTPEGGRAQPLIQNQTARLDAEVDVQALVVEDRLAEGFDTLRTRPALPPIERWQQHLAELDRSHGLIGQLSFDANGVVATPGQGQTFDAKLVGGEIVPRDEALGTAGSLLVNGHDHGVNLTLDPALEHEQLTLITWINISRAPGQDYTTLAHPTVEKFLKNSFSWQINYNAPALVMDRYGPDPNFTEAPLPDDWPDGWHCLASVLDTQAGTAAHYLNGQPLGSSTLTDRDRYAFHELRIGGIDSKLPKAAQRYLNGSLGLFLALDQALPPNQIQQFYQASSGLFRPTD